LLSIAKVVPTGRRHVTIREGETSHSVIFVIESIVRACCIKDNGQELSPFFWSENLITASWESRRSCSRG
jgi:hypothetical protein